MSANRVVASGSMEASVVVSGQIAPCAPVPPTPVSQPFKSSTYSEVLV